MLPIRICRFLFILDPQNPAIPYLNIMFTLFEVVSNKLFKFLSHD